MLMEIIYLDIKLL